MKFVYTIIFAFLVFSTSVSQPKHQPDAAEILHDILKLKVLGSALYVAAHPDDENTRLIAWLSNEKKVQTAYLSMTRGDGGQNLIGPEIREQLGLIRTQELLAARKIDGGKQFFTRANDFGYSKSPEETFEVWDEQKILDDVVWVIRKFRPDIIITRFPVTGEGNHGHHTASAILADKAFEMAGDPAFFPEQLKYVKVWQPKRLFLNTGRWWNPDITGNEPGVTEVEVGNYNPLLGISYSEMAAISRSQHKSQGFGMTGFRGTSSEFLELKKGQLTSEDIFEGIDMSWSRVGADDIAVHIDQIVRNYDPLHPSGSFESLLNLRNKISNIDNKHWKEIKLKELDKLLKAILGLYLEATTKSAYLVPGEPVEVNLELTNRSEAVVSVEGIQWPGEKKDTSFILNNNIAVQTGATFHLPEVVMPSTPYWLRQKPAKGHYKVEDQNLIGKPENDPALEVKIIIEAQGKNLEFTIPLEYKWNDPVAGELRRPVAIVPPVALSFDEQIYLFADGKDKRVEVKVKNFTSSFKGEIKLELPQGWMVEPASIPFEINDKLAEREVSFSVTPPKGSSSVVAIAKTKSSSGKNYDQEVEEIEYDHIPTQALVTISDAEFVKLEVETAGTNIGYIEGAGDAIPSTLRELGYSVTILDEDMIKNGLSQYDAIVVGIRALNTNDRIGFIMEPLLDYAYNGGVLLLQYNTSFRLKTEDFSPYPLTLSRDRVTVEEAPVTILNPSHPVFNYPNKITAKDFDNWVQERGLYFPNQWDDRFEPLLKMSDPGESPTKGGLLVASYGQGYYVYSGLSWFRELPAGVPGAIRLFTNILSLSSAKDAK